MNEKIVAFVTEVANAIVNKALEPEVRESRARFYGRTGHYNFAWIMVSKSDVKVEGSETTVPGLYARTNDMDFMVGYPPSFSQSCTLENPAELVEKIIAFISEKFANQDAIDLLLQTDFSPAGMRMPNYEGDSDAGFSAVHPQAEHVSI